MTAGTGAERTYAAHTSTHARAQTHARTHARTRPHTRTQTHICYTWAEGRGYPAGPAQLRDGRPAHRGGFRCLSKAPQPAPLPSCDS